MRHSDYIRQKDSMQCGVACLAMVCRILGAQYSLEFLTGFCHATTEGVSLKGMKDAASRLGLDSMACRSSIGELTKCPLPAILHWNQNNFVVLHRISRRGERFHIADPGKGYVRSRQGDGAPS